MHLLPSEDQDILPCITEGEHNPIILRQLDASPHTFLYLTSFLPGMKHTQTHTKAKLNLLQTVFSVIYDEPAQF